MTKNQRKTLIEQLVKDFLYIESDFSRVKYEMMENVQIEDVPEIFWTEDMIIAMCERNPKLLTPLSEFIEDRVIDLILSMTNSRFSSIVNYDLIPRVLSSIKRIITSKTDTYSVSYVYAANTFFSIVNKWFIMEDVIEHPDCPYDILIIIEKYMSKNKESRKIYDLELGTIRKHRNYSNAEAILDNIKRAAISK